MLIKLLQLLIPLALTLLGLWQTLVYFRLRQTFSRWPVVNAEITHSRLLNQLEVPVQAVIAFKYSFGGKEYISETPVLRGYELFPNLQYEWGVTKKYRRGDRVKARVHPQVNQVAYLEVAPLSRSSTFLVPLLVIASIAFLYALKTGQVGILKEIYDYLLLQNDLIIIRAENSK